MAVAVRVAVAVGASGHRLVFFVHVMERRRAGMGRSGAARALEAAVRNFPVTALERGGGGGGSCSCHVSSNPVKGTSARPDSHGVNRSRLTSPRLP